MIMIMFSNNSIGILLLPLVLLYFSSSSLSNAELIAGRYKPAYQVTDHAAIDLDYQLMIASLESNNITHASLVYNQGAHSKSYAYVKLWQETGKINKNTAFVGQAADTSVVNDDSQPTTVVPLYAYSDYDAGETWIKLRYATSDVQAEYSFCQVGQNPNPVTSGCLMSNGTIKLDGIVSARELQYSYDPLVDNLNGRTLAGFSIEAQEKMGECDACPYKDYDKYYNYYGVYDYGHQYVMAAFEQRSTEMKFGNVDFATYSTKALSKAIEIAVRDLNIWMYVVREFEDALDDCSKGCASDQCNTDKVNAWDEGIAFYSGSLEEGSGSVNNHHGILSYTLADELCIVFKTCVGQQYSGGGGGGGTSTTTTTSSLSTVGESFVNKQIFELSDKAVELLKAEQCTETRVYVERIVGLMTVPLVQGLLHATYRITSTTTATTTDNDVAVDVDVAKSEAATFAAAVLPILHHCNEDDARYVYQQLKYNSNDDDDDDNKNHRDYYGSIKNVLENNYECMGITCEEVGGIWDQNNMNYKPGASPCKTIRSNDDDPNLALILGLSFGLGIPLLCFILVLCFCRRSRSHNNDKQASKA